MRVERFRTTFVEFIPDDLEDGVLYVSMRYRTVSHLCPCGCGQEVPLSISPTAWQLTFNGEVSLSPSDLGASILPAVCVSASAEAVGLIQGRLITSDTMDSTLPG